MSCAREDTLKSVVAELETRLAKEQNAQADILQQLEQRSDSPSSSEVRFSFLRNLSKTVHQFTFHALSLLYPSFGRSGYLFRNRKTANLRAFFFLAYPEKAHLFHSF